MSTIRCNVRMQTLVFALALLLPRESAYAVLVPAFGVDAGIARMEHAVIQYAGASAPAVFDGYFDPLPADGGFMFTPGFGYPIMNTAVTPFQIDTGKLGLTANVPVFLNTLPDVPSGFGGATTTMVGVGGGGRAGVAANFSLSDLNIGNGFASTNTFGASVVYDNVGGPIIAQFGHFLASDVSVPLGGYAAAGVKTLFEIGDYNAGTGAFTVDSFWEPLPILVAFDGAGPLADAIQGQFFATNTLGQDLTFSAVSTTPLALIPAGKSVRMRGTVTLIADPLADFTMIDLDPTLQSYVQDSILGFGGSSDAAVLLTPEPASIVLVAIGMCGLFTSQRRRHR